MWPLKLSLSSISALSSLCPPFVAIHGSQVKWLLGPWETERFLWPDILVSLDSSPCRDIGRGVPCRDQKNNEVDMRSCYNLMLSIDLHFRMFYRKEKDDGEEGCGISRGSIARS